MRWEARGEGTSYRRRNNRGTRDVDKGHEARNTHGSLRYHDDADDHKLWAPLSHYGYPSAKPQEHLTPPIDTRNRVYEVAQEE